MCTPDKVRFLKLVFETPFSMLKTSYHTKSAWIIYLKTRLLYGIIVSKISGKKLQVKEVGLATGKESVALWFSRRLRSEGYGADC